MNTSKLADIAEITSSIAILVTLVFLVVQMQQNTDAILSQTRQAMLASQQNELTARVEHPEIITSMVKTEALTPIESAQLHTWLLASLTSRLFVWNQYQSGLVDDEQWANEEKVILAVFSPRTNRDWWNKIGKALVDTEFATYVDNYLRDQPVSDDFYNTILTWTNN